MKNIEIHNDEDHRIWSALEKFNFDEFDKDSQVRVALYNKLIEALGYCETCQYFVKNRRWCKMLEFSTGTMDRCADFERAPAESGSVFDAMSDNFVEEQSRKLDATRINKYTHWSNKVGPPTHREEIQESDEEE
jgi:hypothetical protein